MNWIPIVLLIFMGGYLIVFNKSEVESLNAWHAEKSKKHPILFPPYKPNIFFQRAFAIFVGLGFLWGGFFNFYINYLR